MYLYPGIFSSLPLIVLCFQIDYNGQTVFENFFDYSDGVEDVPVKLVKLDITNNNPICPVKISNDDLLIHHLDTVCGALQTSFFHFAVPSSGFELLEPQNLPPGDYFFNGPGRMIYFDHEVQASYCSTCFEKWIKNSANIVNIFSLVLLLYIFKLVSTINKKWYTEK